MSIYGYARISRDEDDTRDSIENQIHIIETYAKENDLKIDKIFIDNNYSGYTFNRPDFNILKETLQKKDTLIIKDLSRLGRHSAYTGLFIEGMREDSINLISIADNIDLSNSSDDMIIGIKTWFNELYVKDISRKVKQSLQQKLKEGMVLTPHHGYMKDPNNKNNIIIDEEAAISIRKIFELYIEGYGFKQIASKLTSMGYKTPAVHKAEKFGINGRKSDNQRHLWCSSTVGRIIKNEAYIGTYRCNVTENKNIKGKRTATDEDKHIIHENFFSPIINKETFDLAQDILENRIKKNKRSKGKLISLFSGVLKCGKCGQSLVSRKSLSDKPRYYSCGTYHRYGNDYCSRHVVYEHELKLVLLYKIKQLLDNAKINLKNVDKLIEERKKKKNNYDRTINGIMTQIEHKKNEIKNYSKQLAKELIDEDLFDELTKESKQHLEILKEQLESVNGTKEIDKDLKKNVITSKTVLDDIIKNNNLENKDIDMLIDEIIIHETDEVGKWGRKKVDIDVIFNTPFVYHEDAQEWVSVPLWLINFKDAFMINQQHNFTQGVN